MKIDSKVTGLLNAKLKDLEVEIGLFKNIKSLQKVAGDDIPSTAQFFGEFEGRLKKKFSVEGAEDFEKLIQAFYESFQKIEYKTKVFLTMDATNATLKRVGANDNALKEIDVLKEQLQKELFPVFNVTEADFETKEIGNV
jgi:predicted hydrocarbon binding protein